LTDEQVLMLTDALPTGYMAAEAADIKPGDVVAVWGAGTIGLFTIQCAFLLGAKQVIVVDRIPERLLMARDRCRAEVINFEGVDVVETIKELTGGRGPDVCIDAVGLEAHGTGLEGFYDKTKQNLRIETGRPHVLREAIQACRKGGTISLAGVYGGFLDKVPMGAAFNKGLTFKMGQTHVHKYMRPLLQHIENGEINPSFMITHKMSLDEAPQAYKMFNEKKDNCIKVVMKT
jgi:threonine dehydrogenase-like Zn-dependent dehydrogenase